jgi:hypothetical protein
MYAIHIPTGKHCRILRQEGDRSFCNFGAAADPFTWVLNTELSFEDPEERADVLASLPGGAELYRDSHGRACAMLDNGMWLGAPLLDARGAVDALPLADPYLYERGARGTAAVLGSNIITRLEAGGVVYFPIECAMFDRAPFCG